MAHHLYAEISEDAKTAYYDSDFPGDPEVIEDYPYDRVPSVGVKQIRSSDWLPEHLTDAVWDEFSPNQARMYADALAREVGGYQFDQAQDPNAERLLNIVQWLRYWARQGVSVHGGP